MHLSFEEDTHHLSVLEAWARWKAQLQIIMEVRNGVIVRVSQHIGHACSMGTKLFHQTIYCV